MPEGLARNFITLLQETPTLQTFWRDCSKEHLRMTASVCLKSKLQMMQFTHKPKTFNFRIYKVFPYLLRFSNFSSNKFIFAFESFSLKMYIVLAKAYYFCMFLCFAFMHALLSWLHTWMLSSDIKRAHRQNIPKQNSISNVWKMS